MQSRTINIWKLDAERCYIDDYYLMDLILTPQTTIETDSFDINARIINNHILLFSSPRIRNNKDDFCQICTKMQIDRGNEIRKR